MMKNPLVYWALWFSCTCIGLLALADHAGRPGQSARASALWPAQSKLQKATNTFTLLTFLHPLCPCSRASLAELARIQGAAGDHLAITVVIGLPQGLVAADAREMIETVQHIPGAQIVLDPDDVETRRFGCYTSGQALLYSPEGKLRYQGGITGSRGHEGDNAGKSALLAALEQTAPAAASAPVYGCCLRNGKN